MSFYFCPNSQIQKKIIQFYFCPECRKVRHLLPLKCKASYYGFATEWKKSGIVIWPCDNVEVMCDNGISISVFSMCLRTPNEKGRKSCNKISTLNRFPPSLSLEISAGVLTPFRFIYEQLRIAKGCSYCNED